MLWTKCSEQSRGASFEMWLTRHCRKSRERFLVCLAAEPKGRSSARADDVKLLRPIGKGAFGVVVLARRAEQPLAVKCIKKARIAANASNTLRTTFEKRLLQTLTDLLPKLAFVIKAHFAYQTTAFLCLALEYVAGGDLFDYLYVVRNRHGLNEDEARFYTAQILLAFQYLHALDVAYRDLKPENLLLGADGNLKLCDFGFAKHVPERTYTFCGTLEYCAPELYDHKGHGWAVDYWALGVLVFEMNAGRTPFPGGAIRDHVYAVRNTRPKYPRRFSDDLRDLIDRLLAVQVAHRLGCGLLGGAEVRRHRWFGNVDFAAVHTLRYEPPYRPPSDSLDSLTLSASQQTLLRDFAEVANDSTLARSDDLFADW